MRSTRRLPTLTVAAACLALSGCAETELIVHTAKQIGGHERQGSVYKVGDPYRVDGVWYYPKVDYDYAETGIASWYGEKFHGRTTANGELYDMNKATAAHRTLPLPSMVLVTNLENGRAIRVRVNDRGPFAHGRIIDLSRRAAQLLGFARKGTAKVRVEVLAPESRQLAALYGADGRPLPVQVAGAEPTAVRAAQKTVSPTISAAPRTSVTQVALSETAPPAASAAAGPAVPEAPTGSAEDLVPAPTASESQVVRVPVQDARMYVQAGAFTEYANANRLRARLSVLGRTEVSQVQIGDQTFFRVRVGPIARLAEADRLLERLIRSEFSDAKLIVDR